VIEEGGPALLFKRPKGADFPVVTNLFGTPKRLELAFGKKPREFVETAARAATELLPPTREKLWAFRSFIGDALRVGTKRATHAPVTDVVEDAPDLTRLPALTQWPEDGGPFLTLPLVYSERPSDGPSGRSHSRQSNLGVYRMQIHGPRTAGVHWQIAKGGGFHYHEAEARGAALPLTIFLGGPPALILAAVAPLPEGLPELLVASLLLGKKLPMAHVPSHPHRLVADAEFALTGSVPPGTRKPEGPFGDHYGYYSLKHDYPVFEVARIYRRRDAIFPATVVGKPRQEDFYIGDTLQELLSPLFPIVMPAVVDLWSYGDTGFHSLAAAVVKDRYRREAMTSAFRILGEGQLALTKFLLVTDARRDLRDFRGLLAHILARCRFETDLFLFGNLAMDTLDYTGPKVNEGSKGVLRSATCRARSAARCLRARALSPSSVPARSSSTGRLSRTTATSRSGSPRIRRSRPGRSSSSPTMRRRRRGTNARSCGTSSRDSSPPRTCTGGATSCGTTSPSRLLSSSTRGPSRGCRSSWNPTPGLSRSSTGAGASTSRAADRES